MPPATEWQIAPAVQPKPADYSYDLDRALAAVVSVKTMVAEDAFTAEVLGVERSGNGVLIRPDGLILTIGYLITEAETVWIGLSDGRIVPGHAVGYDQTTGFGLIQALAKVDLPTLAFGSSRDAAVGQRVVVAGAGGRAHSVAARIVAKQEFAGYWEYLLDEAIFTVPAHPYWGGTALIGPAGDLLGIGSLRLERARESGEEQHLNMIVPIDLAKPILDDLLTIGRPKQPPRPWLGLYTIEADEKIAVAGLAKGGPAERGGLQPGDVIVDVDGEPIGGLADFYRKMWAVGAVGSTVPLKVARDGDDVDLRVVSADRNAFLKAPKLH